MEKEKTITLVEEIPYVYWWNIGQLESSSLCLLASCVFSCLKKECGDFATWLNETFNGNEELNINSLYSRSYATLPDRETLHVTAKYNGKKVDGENATTYHNRPDVQESLGKVDIINIIGFFFTPRTFGARVRLTDNQLKIYDQDDSPGTWQDKLKKREEGDNKADPFMDILDQLEEKFRQNLKQKTAVEEIMMTEIRGDATTAASDVLVSSHVIDVDRYKDFPDPEDELFIEHLQIQPQDQVILGNFSPVKGKGSRAHVTLGCARDIPPVVTGFDLANLVICEQNALENNCNWATYELSNGWLRFFGEDGFMFYPKEQYFVTSVFTAKN